MMFAIFSVSHCVGGVLYGMFFFGNFLMCVLHFIGFYRELSIFWIFEMRKGQRCASEIHVVIFQVKKGKQIFLHKQVIIFMSFEKSIYVMF